MMKIFSFLKVFDRFKRPILLYSRNSKNHSTRMGVVVSILIYMFLIYYLIKSDMVMRKNPKTSDQTVESSFRPEIALSNIVFDLSNDESVSYVDPTIFSFRGAVSYMKQNENSNNGFEYVYNAEEDLRLCREEDFESEVFKKMALSNKYCFNQSNIKIKGYWDEKEVKYVTVKLKRCVNGTGNENQVKCKSDEEIDQFFSSEKYFNIYFSNPFTDLSDYYNPIKNIWRNEYQILDPNIFKDVSLFFKKLEFKDDRNFPFVSPSVYELYSFDKKENDVSFSKRGPELLEATLYSSILIQKKERIYQGLPEVFGNIGGLFGIFLFIGFIITSPEFRLNMILGLFEERVSFKRALDPSSFNSNKSQETVTDEILSRDRAKSEQRPHICASNPKIPLENKEERKKEILYPTHDEERIPSKKEIMSPSVFQKPHFPTNIYDGTLGRFSSNRKRQSKEVELGNLGQTQGLEKEKSVKIMDIKHEESKLAEPAGGTEGTKGIQGKRDLEVNTNEPNDRRIMTTENADDNIDLLPNQSKKPKENLKKRETKYSLKAIESSFSFTIIEYFVYQTKKLLNFELTEKQKFFSKLEHKYTEELNVGIILQRIFLLESKIDYAFGKLENMRPSIKKRKVGLNYTLHDFIEK